MRVLLVEDDDELRYAFATALKQHGISTLGVASVPAALHVLSGFKPHVALLDLILGDQTSLDLAGQLAVRSPDTEIVYVTGSDLFPHAEFFQMHLPIAAVLRKPVDLLQLVELVSHIARNPSSRGGDAQQQDVLANG